MCAALKLGVQSDTGSIPAPLTRASPVLLLLLLPSYKHVCHTLKPNPIPKPSRLIAPSPCQGTDRCCIASSC
jgi:hypothetical protein